MKTWIRPMVVEDNLVANARVAESVCYGLSCSVGKEGSKKAPYGFQWKQNESNGVTHKSSGTGNCSDANANRIITGDGGVFYGSRIGEKSSDQGWLPAYIDKYYDENHNGKVDTGDVIYWHTTNDNNITWNHWGRVLGTSANHPNHS